MQIYLTALFANMERQWKETANWYVLIARQLSELLKNDETSTIHNREDDPA
jgi:hypothetical protein